MNMGIILYAGGVACCLSCESHTLLFQAQKDAKMECKLIVKKTKLTVGEYPRAEVEIKNTSKQNLVITFNTHVLEFLDLEIANSAGKKISVGKYGGRFSPYSPEPHKQMILRPGEAHRAPVGVFGNMKKSDRTTPGVYRIIAIYEYDKVRAVADPVELTIESKE
jgi:hypothetical protein